MTLWNAPLAAGPVHATVALPGSKSITNRALVLAVLADGPSTITGALRSRDTNLMIAALRALEHQAILVSMENLMTFPFVASAVEALNESRVQRLILVRPAVEAGEKLGFLPGDLSQKVDPYLRPLYDALYEMLGVEKVVKLLEKNVIEIAPLAFMRGRTLNDAFVILDEAQNTTIEQMKMFLTRLGFGSKMVVTGDVTQVDLPGGATSGLRAAVGILRGIDDIHIAELSSADVVRHRLVAEIVDAYAQFEEQLDAAKRPQLGARRIPGRR